MPLCPGWKAPDFNADTTAGPICFHKWGSGCWRIVVTHPSDYDPRDFLAGIQWARNCLSPILILGLHGHEYQEEKDIFAGFGNAIVSEPNFANVLDISGSIAALWQGIAVDAGPAYAPLEEHAVFIVDEINTIRATLTYFGTTGRKFESIIRLARGIGVGCVTDHQHTRYAA
ncbi:peroxidase [Komagataeibacter sucrofermentans]|uniref:Peroxidase n=1 Tax=Komagataeibacter sucrofermentans TaxID=1053551 RepID=A0A318QX76_9PROT|nr:peroxidase [Komagataeibacter sucrofermentans]PYD77513.1 peroxidase [Komagataeibacter sucrofermentans]GBQ51557.1 peroxiredoxin [Komagataeibacter sucrofermentans DSM 15973]